MGTRVKGRSWQVIIYGTFYKGWKPRTSISISLKMSVVFVTSTARYAAALVVFVAGLNLLLGNAIIWLSIIFMQKNLVRKMKQI